MNEFDLRLLLLMLVVTDGMCKSDRRLLVLINADAAISKAEQLVLRLGQRDL